MQTGISNILQKRKQVKEIRELAQTHASQDGQTRTKTQLFYLQVQHPFSHYTL